MTIYVAQNTKTQEVKIGFTKYDDPKNRLQQFEQKYKAPMILLFTIPGKTQNEKRLHRWFDFYHLGNEWFSPEILQTATPEFLTYLVANPHLEPKFRIKVKKKA